jgi:hypothetical protein
VSYCQHFSSVVRPSTFHILIFSSETTGPIATKLWWNGPWMAPFQNCVRWSDLLQNCRVGRSWCVDHLYPIQIFDIINGFWVISNSGHVGWCTASPDTILKLDTLVMIQTKFGFHWSSTFRGEDFWKKLMTYNGRRRRTPSDGNSSPDPKGQVS